MRVIPSKIKKNLQGTKNGVDKAENQINDLEHKEEKKTFDQNREKKKESKKRRTG